MLRRQSIPAERSFGKLTWTRASLGVGLYSALLCVGCSPEAFGDAEELDAVLTVRQPDRDFTAYETYSMPDRLFDLAGLVESPREIPDWVQPLVLKTVAEEMATAGYRRVAYASPPTRDSDESEVVVLVGAVSSDNWVFAGYYNWWPGYWYAYPIVVPINFASGSVIVTMLRPQEANEDEDGRLVVPAVWAAGMRGVATGSQDEGTRRVRSALAQAFDQSPYLRTGSPTDPVYDAGVTPAGDGGSEEGGARRDGSTPGSREGDFR